MGASDLWPVGQQYGYTCTWCPDLEATIGTSKLIVVNQKHR